MPRQQWMRFSRREAGYRESGSRARFLTQSSLEESPGRLHFMFCTGVALYLLRDRFILSGRWFAAVPVVLALSTFNTLSFAIVHSLALPYAMASLAFLPKGPILEFNRLGDYSYGTHIYAHPIRQSLLAAVPLIGWRACS